MLTQKSVAELIAAFGSSDPTPGGGSAAALAAAVGTALFAMVAGLPKTRTGAAEEREALDVARPQLLELQTQLTDLIDRDAAAYDLVVAAYRLPKTTDEEKAARKTAVQAAMRKAAEVPLETMAAAAEAIELGATVAMYGNPSARSDMAVATQLIGMSAMQGAWLNVDANLGSLTDPALVESLVAQAKTHMDTAGMALHRIMRTASVSEAWKEAGARFGHGGHAAPKAAHAAEMLAHIGSPEARRALEAWAASPDPETAEVGRQALEKLAKLEK